ncbi:MAG: DUF2809 domain-containing protein [Oscillatoriales cyanobacterium RM2_1_1]|nr:DUF2809 domain-containing protein [Oscillatoriales cyanobacterium SM2_3_0]NJO46304.1 DUF2809 domain-containing protein [Oscillatoriales cyanobacterium RM2_1_1]
MKGSCKGLNLFITIYSVSNTARVREVAAHCATTSQICTSRDVVLIWPKVSPGKVAVWVFIITCILEVLQLWKPPFLQAIRATLMGRLLLGTSFSLWDFLYYALGCAIAWGYLRQIESKVKV